MDDRAYNSRVDFINNASRQLESKLATENKKLHDFLQNDVNNKIKAGGHHEVNGSGGERNGTSNSPAPHQSMTMHYETNSKSKGQPIDDMAADHKKLLVNGKQKHEQEAHFENCKTDQYRPVKFWMPSAKLVNYEGPTKKTIPPEPGSYGAEVTTWQWTKASERTAASGKPRH